MTFEEWYKEEYPDLIPEQDDFLLDLKHAFEAGISQGLKTYKEEGHLWMD